MKRAIKPDDLQPRTLPSIIERLERGESMNAICASPGMPDRKTVRRWCDGDRAVAEQIYEARETGFLDRAEQAVAAAKAATDPQLGRLAFDAERWFLGKLSIAFAERAPRIDSQTNVQVNVDGDPFGRFADLMERASAHLASGAGSTHLVVEQSPPGPSSADGGLDDVAAAGGPGLG